MSSDDNLALTAVSKQDLAAVSQASLSKSLKGGFSVQSAGDRAARKFRVETEAAAVEWVKAIRAGLEHRAKYKSMRAASARSPAAAASGNARRGRADSEGDDDDEDGGGGGGRRGRRADRSDSDDGSGGDSDRDDDDGDGRLPPPPRWFAQYDTMTTHKDKEAKWMEISLRWFDQLFEQVTQVRAHCC